MNSKGSDSPSNYDYYYSPREGKITIKNSSDYEQLKKLYSPLSPNRFPEGGDDIKLLDKLLSANVEILNKGE